MSTRSKSRGHDGTVTVEQPPSKHRKISEMIPPPSESHEVAKSKKVTVADIFETLEYGPAPESSAAVDKWLDEHDRAFGHFINGQWVKPEG